MNSMNDLGKNFLAQLYTILTGGDAKVPPSKSNFISWCMPGIPFNAEDFTFAEKGIGGGADAEEDRLIVQQASNFSNLIDFIPDVTGVYNGDSQQTIYRTDSRRLSKIYGDVLKLSKVTKEELTEEQKAKLEKFRNFLFQTKTVKNIVTDEEEEVTEDGNVLKLYNEMQNLYDDARQEYVSKMSMAAAATGSEGKGILMDWTMNENSYYKKVAHAEKMWISKGYRNEIDQINEYIRQTTQRSLKLWKGELQDLYEKGKRSTLTGENFYAIQPTPGNFANSGGWTAFTYSSKQETTSSSTKTNKWAGEASGKYFLFSGSGKAERESSKSTTDEKIDEFEISFEFTQVLISRPWFYPEFFGSRGWILGDEWNLQYNEIPTDGAHPPQGNFIAYPTKALFVRNVKIRSKQFVSSFEEFSKSSSYSGKGKKGWGPISFEASASHSNTQGGNEKQVDTTEDTLTVKGMQIIGFVNYLLPKSPNPLEDLEESDFE